MFEQVFNSKVFVNCSFFQNNIVVVVAATAVAVVVVVLQLLLETYCAKADTWEGR